MGQKNFETAVQHTVFTSPLIEIKLHQGVYSVFIYDCGYVLLNLQLALHCVSMFEVSILKYFLFP